jgi:cysteine sulfinate desulfinase/cysteine desulfurase-like protein
MAISTISSPPRVQGISGSTKLVFSKKAINPSFFASDATVYANQTATYYINSGSYALVAAATNTSSSITISNSSDIFFISEAFDSNSVILKYFTIPQGQTGEVDIYFTTGAINVNIFEVKTT